MVPLLRERERVGFQSRARGRHLDRPLRRAAQLDDPLREQIHVLLCRIDKLAEQLVEGNEVRTLDIPMCLLGLMLEIDTVGESRVQNRDDLSPRAIHIPIWAPPRGILNIPLIMNALRE